MGVKSKNSPCLLSAAFSLLLDMVFSLIFQFVLSIWRAHHLPLWYTVLCPRQPEGKASWLSGQLHYRKLISSIPFPSLGLCDLYKGALAKAAPISEHFSEVFSLFRGHQKQARAAIILIWTWGGKKTSWLVSEFFFLPSSWVCLAPGHAWSLGFF